MYSSRLIDAPASRRSSSLTLSRILSYGFAILCVIFMARATGGFLSGNDARDLSDDGGGGDSPAFAAVCMIFYLITGLWLIGHSQHLRSFLHTQKLLVFFLFLCLASTLWSILPMGTFVRAISLIGNCCIALYLYNRFERQNLMRIFCLAFLSMAAGSILISLIVPSIGIMHGGENSGNWRGLFIHKNPCSYAFVIGVIISWWGVSNDTRWRGAWRLLMLLSLFLVVMAQSRTGFVALTLCVFFGVWLWIKSGAKGEIRVISDVSFLLALLSAFWVFSNAEYFLALMGRDATLTGRTKIWEVAFDYLMNRPIFGYGYQASWRSPEGMPLQMLSAGWLFNPSQSHNSFVDIALGVGFVGVGVVCFWLLRMMALTLFIRSLFTDPLMRMFVLIDLSVIVTGMSGRTVMQTNSLGTVLLVISSIYFADCLKKLTFVRRQRATLASAGDSPAMPRWQ